MLKLILTALLTSLWMCAMWLLIDRLSAVASKHFPRAYPEPDWAVLWFFQAFYWLALYVYRTAPWGAWGAQLIGWIVLGWVCGSLFVAWFCGKLFAWANRKPMPQAEPVNLVAEPVCNHNLMTMNQAGVICITCGERVA